MSKYYLDTNKNSEEKWSAWIGPWVDDSVTCQVVKCDSKKDAVDELLLYIENPNNKISEDIKLDRSIIMAKNGIY